MLDRIVLIGAGKTSGSLVERLAHIAPLTVLDTSAAALDVVSTRELQGTAGMHPIIKRTGDGTSRLVLGDVRGDPQSSVGLVVAAGDDRVAVEASLLGAELGYKPIIAVVNEREAAQRCEKLGARPLVRAELMGQLVEQSLLQGGLGVTSAVGFGRGEILEFGVLPSSPAIGVPLSELRAEGWRVAAIYRGSELVLPTGGTTIAADDRVLVVGDPAQLPHVAERLRVGLPTFPLLHGPNVVVYLPAGRDGAVETEAELLTTRTRAARLVRAYPGANTGARKIIDTPGPDGVTAQKFFQEATLEGDGLESHLTTIRKRHPGVVVARAVARGSIEVLLGRGGRDSILCNEVGVPVLFSRGSTLHERISLCVTDGSIDVGVAEVALDLARMFEVALHILRVRLPSYLQPAEAATDDVLESIAQRARLYGLKPEIQQMEGNPIAEWLRAIAPNDLAVISRRRASRDSFSAPDLALRVARKAKSSVLVVTVKQ
jgi:Trk K+ transport system NAD-binding subunit